MVRHRLLPLVRCLLPVALCLFLPACSTWDGVWDTIIDRSLIEQQQAEIARLQAETEQIKAETEALRQQARQAEKEREDCNTAFYTFEEARKSPEGETAIAKYREGLALCPTDDVAHNELGELYLRHGPARPRPSSPSLKRRCGSTPTLCAPSAICTTPREIFRKTSCGIESALFGGQKWQRSVLGSPRTFQVFG